MFKKISKRLLSSWRFVILLIASTFLISVSFFFLVRQRNTIASTNLIGEFALIISAVLIISIVIFFTIFIFRVYLPIKRKKILSFSNKFSLYFITMALMPAIVAGILGLVLVNFGINDWFNVKIKSVINNSVKVAEGYVEEHNNSIKSDIYAMSNDLNKNYNVYITNRFKFEEYFEKQSVIRSLPEAYLIDSRGNIIMSKTYKILTQYYRPSAEVLSRASNGELAILTSTTVNKVYALIKLPNFVNAYLYVGRSLDPNVTKSFDETKSAVREYSNLEKNRSKIAFVFMLIYIFSIVILVIISILLGIRFSKRIVEPITDLIKATNLIKKGSFDVTLPKSNDFIELNRLSDSFNTMSTELGVQRKLLANSEKHAAWSEIARTIAHEIKNPLTPIQLSNDRIRKKLKDININDQSLNECLDIISRQVNDIGNLVNEFSNFARMPKPVFKLNKINTIIENCISAKLISCNDMVKIHFYKKKDFLFNCDELQITQVFNNIIQNSINSIIENNKVNGEINIEIDQGTNQLSFNIIDNGIGIVNTKSVLIEPYFTTRKKSGGTGLGLSIVNKIITDHDGILEISNNNQNNGALIKIIFNLKNE